MYGGWMRQGMLEIDAQNILFCFHRIKTALSIDKSLDIIIQSLICTIDLS